MAKETKEQPYKIIATKFLGINNSGMYTYEITFNQSIVHTGRFSGIEKGLDDYREKENKEYDKQVLKKASEIIKKRNQLSN